MVIGGYILLYIDGDGGVGIWLAVILQHRKRFILAHRPFPAPS